MRSGTRPTFFLAGALFSLCALALAFPTPAARAQTTFTVTVAAKTAQHPYFGQGWPEGYVVDGVQGKVLTLVRGRTYTFRMQSVPGMHPFYISTSTTGEGADAYSQGVTNNFVSGNQALTFTPPEDAPDVLYYQCGSHGQMGSQINLISESELELDLVAQGLTHPITLAEPPDGSGRLFVADQIGQIRIITADGTLLPEPFLDIQHWMAALNAGYDERGLLGFAFHPQYATNGRFFIYYSIPRRSSAPAEYSHSNRLSEFRVSSTDPNRADDASQRFLLETDQPQPNHNAGSLAFHPHTGQLFLSMGDGGGANDIGTGHVEDWYGDNAGGNGQDITQNLLGSILRIDVDNVPTGQAYGIPVDNPFVGVDGMDEIWAYGFRNPYGMSFDIGHNATHNHLLITADAGQDRWEEVSVVTAGGNFGWNVREGAHCFDAENPSVSPETCPAEDPEGDPLIDPVIDFANSNQEGGGLGNVVVGGHLYRGTALEGKSGTYYFGVWSQGSAGEGELLPGAVFAATPAEEGPWPFEQVSFATSGPALDDFILGFGQDRGGEVYVLTTDEVGPTGTTGKVYRIGAAGLPIANERDPQRPRALRLEENFPNPFTGSTTIRFHLARQGNVSVRIYDTLGRLIRHVADAAMAPGVRTVIWDGKDDAGQSVPAGRYLYRVTSGIDTETRSMVLLR